MLNQLLVETDAMGVSHHVSSRRPPPSPGKEPVIAQIAPKGKSPQGKSRRWLMRFVALWPALVGWLQPSEAAM